MLSVAISSPPTLIIDPVLYYGVKGLAGFDSWDLRTRIAMPLSTYAFPSALALLLLPGLAVQEGEQEATRTKQDLDAFRAYLAKEHPGKKWQRGPARLDS